MTSQEVMIAFQIAMSLIAFLGGWVLKTFAERIGALEVADKQLTKEVYALRETLPASYVRIEYYRQDIEKLFSALDRIENKLDKKVDK